MKSTDTTENQEKKIEKLVITDHNGIKEIYDMIGNIANENSIKLLQKPVTKDRENKTTSNNIRMTHGDINYLESNKSIFYFDRGIRGKQTFTNSMYSLDRQPKHKDIVVIDEIVFTSNCKCDSSKQHKEMFPHYRASRLVQLDSRAQLDSTNMKTIIYARNKNATTETPITVRSMLIRY